MTEIRKGVFQELDDNAIKQLIWEMRKSGCNIPSIIENRTQVLPIVNYDVTLNLVILCYIHGADNDSGYVYMKIVDFTGDNLLNFKLLDNNLMNPMEIYVEVLKQVMYFVEKVNYSRHVTTLMRGDTLSIISSLLPLLDASVPDKSTFN